MKNPLFTIFECIKSLYNERLPGKRPKAVSLLVFTAKMFRNEQGQTLSIARNRSDDYNRRKFSQEKERRHFTGDLRGVFVKLNSSARSPSGFPSSYSSGSCRYPQSARGCAGSQTRIPFRPGRSGSRGRGRSG